MFYVAKIESFIWLYFRKMMRELVPYDIFHQRSSDEWKLVSILCTDILSDKIRYFIVVAGLV